MTCPRCAGRVLLDRTLEGPREEACYVCGWRRTMALAAAGLREPEGGRREARAGDVWARPAGKALSEDLLRPLRQTSADSR